MLLQCFATGSYRRGGHFVLNTNTVNRNVFALTTTTSKMQTFSFHCQQSQLQSTTFTAFDRKTNTNQSHFNNGVHHCHEEIRINKRIRRRKISNINNNYPSLSLSSLFIHHNNHRNNNCDYVHQQKQAFHISMQTIVLGGGSVLIIKKFVGYKFLKWYGVKNLYKWYYRTIARALTSIKPRNVQKKERALRMVTNMFRRSDDWTKRNSTFVSAVAYVDRKVTNLCLFIPAKMVLGMHLFLKHFMLKQAHIVVQKYHPPSTWYGPLMFNTFEMIAFLNMVCVIQYSSLINVPQLCSYFDYCFVSQNMHALQQNCVEFRQYFKDNPREYERKQYIKLRKKAYV